jgi:hypothetical protein
VLYSRTVSLPFRLRALALVVSLPAASAAAQDLPLVTETALTAKARTLVLEAGLEAIADEPSYVTGLERNRWDGPLLRLVYSPADNVELDLEWIVRVGVWGEEGREVQGSDWGDVTLRAKWRIKEWGRGRPTVAARFGVSLPQTEYEDEEFRPLGLGPNTLRAFAQALVTQPLGSVRLDANAGLLLFDEVLRPHEQRDFLLFGAALEWTARPGVAIVGEVAGRLGDGHPGAEQRAEARLGARLGRGRLRVGAALRLGLTEADGSWGAQAGLTFTLRPPT